MCLVQAAAAQSSRTSNSNLCHSTSALVRFIFIVCVNQNQLLFIGVLLSIALNKTSSHSACNVHVRRFAAHNGVQERCVCVKHTGNVKTGAFSKFARGSCFDTYYMMSHSYLLV